MADIVHRIGIRAPADRVYEAVATAQGVAGWWTRDTAGGESENGPITTQFRRPDGQELGRMIFEVTSRDPYREVRWRFTDGPPEWIDTEATFELAEDGDMTILVFGHRAWREQVEFMAHCSMKWATFLLSLRDFLETGHGRPAPDDLKIDNWN